MENISLLEEYRQKNLFIINTILIISAILIIGLLLTGIFLGNTDSDYWVNVGIATVLCIIFPAIANGTTPPRIVLHIIAWIMIILTLIFCGTEINNLIMGEKDFVDVVIIFIVPIVLFNSYFLSYKYMKLCNTFKENFYNILVNSTYSIRDFSYKFIERKNSIINNIIFSGNYKGHNFKIIYGDE